MKRFSDFAKDDAGLDGDKLRIDDALNIELLVTGYRLTPSKYEKNKSGKCLTLQVEIEGRRRVIFTGSDVLVSQLEKYGDEIPFNATIKKIDRYYTLS